MPTSSDTIIVLVLYIPSAKRPDADCLITLSDPPFEENRGRVRAWEGARGVQCTPCRLITYWPARSMLTSFEKNSCSRISLPGYLRLCCFAIGGKRRKDPHSPARIFSNFHEFLTNFSPIRAHEFRRNSRCASRPSMYAARTLPRF